MITKRFSKFLGTFDNSAAHQQPPQGAPTQQAPAPQAAPAPIQVVPVAALGELIDLGVQRALKANQPAPAPVQAPARPAAPAATPESEGISATEAAKLRKEVRDSNARAEALALETYKLQKLAQYKAAGVGLIESLLWGTTQAELDQAFAYSQQEFARIQQEILAQHAPQQQQQQVQQPPVQQQQPAPQQQQGQPVQPAAPQGFVTQQGAPVQQPTAQAPQPAAPVGLPGYAAPSAGTQPQPQQGITHEQLQMVTNSNSVRNGTYAANRAALMAGLAAASGGGPQGQPFSFNPGMNLAPPVPRQAPAQVPVATSQHPAMIGNPYAGVQIPQVRPQQGILNQQQAPVSMPHTPGITPNFNPAFPQRQAPVTQGFSPQGAPQPADLQTEVSPGVYVPNGQVLDANGVNAAQAAAQTAIAGMRGKANRMAPTH